MMQDHDQRTSSNHKSQTWYQNMASSPIIRGGIIGAIVTAVISWNNNKHGKIDRFLKRWHFIRHFVTPITTINYYPITSYHYTNLDIVANNFYCYSGAPGIGKSRHFQYLVCNQSLKRPSLYISFKAVGRQNNFQNDLAQQLNYGVAATLNGGIIGQIVKAIKTLHQINEYPQRFLRKYFMMNVIFFGLYTAIFSVPVLLYFKSFLFVPLFVADCYYLYFMRPMITQAKRRTIPLIVFDDLNKLEHLGMLAQITRLFKILQAKSANLMMISSNQDTWAKLRRQPGMKDRLRIRHIKYNHVETSNKMVQLIEEDPKLFEKYFTTHPLFSVDIIKELIKFFIGKRQMSIRRFNSVLKLVDQEQYEKLLMILQNKEELSLNEVVTKMEQVIFRTEMLTMVVYLRSAKRQLPQMSQQDYINNLSTILKNRKLPSDSKVGAVLKVYNVMRDIRSQYVINGGYILKVFELAFQEYKKQIDAFKKTQ